MDPEQRFDVLCDAFAGQPGVALPDTSGRRTFGSSTLKIKGSIFAMLSGGRLVVKLPRERVQALIDDGTGEPFDSGTGRPMRQWLSVVAEDERTWHALAREAMGFVSSRT